MRVERTRRGARLVEGDSILSEVLARPGPTHAVFDVLAAAIDLAAPGPRVAVLGFGGGGLVAPLRALGWAGPLAAVDLAPRGERVFRRLCGSWAGDVRFRRAEAARWLERTSRWDLIVDDLSVPDDLGACKPPACLGEIPRLARRRLGPEGIYVANLLPFEDRSWSQVFEAVTRRWPSAVAIALRGWANRVVLAGPELEARAVSRDLRERLDRLASRVEPTVRALL